MLANKSFLDREVPDTGDMKIPTFYAEDNTEEYRYVIAGVICMSVVGGVFGGIHCIGWFFTFPSSAEAMLWRVSSAVLTGIAFLSPFILGSLTSLYRIQLYFGLAVSAIIMLVYVVSRLLLIVEAFISLRHLTPGMLALVNWTSFIPHMASHLIPTFTRRVLLLVHRILISCYRLQHDLALARSNLKCAHLNNNSSESDDAMRVYADIIRENFKYLPP